MNSSGGDRPQRRPGFPIRTPSDQRLVGSSPRHFAASHVLHRPPDAKASTVCPYNTTHKTTKQNKLLEQIYRKIKMLASTIQFSHNTNHHYQPPPRNTRPATSGNDRTQEQQHPTTTRHPTRATKQEEDTVPFQTPDSAPTYQHHFPRRGRTMRPHRQASTQNKRDPTTDPTGATSSGSRLLKIFGVFLVSYLNYNF